MVKKFIITSFFALMFSLISCGCEFSSPSMPAEQYGFSIISSNQYPYVNIDSMQNKEIEAQINSLLKNVPVCLLEDPSGWIKDSKVEVVFQTEDYLSILYSVSLNDEGNVEEAIRFGITVDMNTGKRLFLNDFIEVNQVYKLFEELETSPETFSPAITKEDVDKLFEEASISEQEYLENIKSTDPYAYYFSGAYIRSKSSFYLKEDEIVIILNEHPSNDIHINH